MDNNTQWWIATTVLGHRHRIEVGLREPQPESNPGTWRWYGHLDGSTHQWFTSAGEALRAVLATIRGFVVEIVPEPEPTRADLLTTCSQYSQRAEAAEAIVARLARLNPITSTRNGFVGCPCCDGHWEPGDPEDHRQDCVLVAARDLDALINPDRNAAERAWLLEDLRASERALQSLPPAAAARAWCVERLRASRERLAQLDADDGQGTLRG